MESGIKYFAMGMLIIWGIGIGSASVNVKAQNYNEIFRQKKTQEKYLLKQIAYLKLYADQAWKGYKLVSGGLETIGGFTSGEFRLHEAFISARSTVSSLVRKDFRVEEIIKFQLSINSSFKALVKSSALAQAPDFICYNAVQEKVMAECSADLDELTDIVLSGDLEMNDSERLSRLGKIHSSMQQKESFTRRFCEEALVLLQSQKTEKRDIESIRRLYEKN